MLRGNSLLTSVAITVAMFASASRLSAQTNLLAYEGFNYPAAVIAGQSGGSGWSGGWVDVSANSAESIVAGSLQAGTTMPLGFDARSVGNSLFIANGSRAGRLLDTSANGPFGQAGYLDSNGNIGANGKTLYVSFLQQSSSAGYFYEFEFHRDNLGDPGRLAGVGNDVANSTQVHLRAPNSTHTPLGVGNTNVNFYVVRIDFKTGNDDVTVYRNPDGVAESDNDPMLTMLSVADLSFDGLSVGAYLNGVTVKTDEIRVGSTWASVLGDPPTFVLQPTNQSLYAGQSVTLSAAAQSAAALHYQWYRIASGSTNLLAGKTAATLAITAAQPGDAGQYFVAASNLLGFAASAVASVTVQPINVAIAGSTSIPYQVGSNVSINATVNGAAPVVLQWFKDGQPVAGATTATLELWPTSPFTAGQYVLVATNAYGSVTSSVVNVFPGTGGLLAYEGFDFGLAEDSGGFGWAAGWVNLSGSSQTSSNSLVAGANAPAGFDAHSTGGNLFVANASRRGRLLDCSSTGNFAQRGYLDAFGNIGADAKTLYLSFLQQADGTSLFYEFELHRGNLGDGGRMGGVGNDTGDNNVHLRVQSPPGGSSAQYDLGTGNTNVNFYVIRIDFKPGNDDVFVYRNPTSVTEPGVPTLVVSNAADLSFDGISLAAYVNGRTVMHDEIRLGATWTDVLGNIATAQLRFAQRTNDVSQLLLAGAPNFNYPLQAATNIVGPWANIGSVAVSSLGVGRFGETNESAQRFYRTTNSLAWLPPSSTEMVFADFEQPTYGAWVTTGTAFGPGPAPGTLSNQNPVSGYAGFGLVNSYLGGDTTTGTLTSPTFVISKPFMRFLIGGGNLPGVACMNLIVSNVVVQTATGSNAEALTQQQWDVSAWLGQTAVVQIVDNATGGWGHINVDQIVFADSTIVSPTLTRVLLLTNSLLNFPVKNGGPMRRVTLTIGGNPVRDFDIELADGTPDWWAFTDVSEYSNQTATISVNSLTAGSTGLSSIAQSNGIVGATNLYSEPLRPQFHFSSARGWLNDANGVFFHNGKYHLYYQHNPYGWNWGNMHWGHAVSTDMVNWQQVLPEGIYPHSYGDMVFSGSAVVDANNTSGFKSGTNDVIVAAYTSTGRGECVASSTNGGLTFTDYPNNPVVVHNGRDPHLLWYAPSNYWVMALYDETGGGGISFYTSSNLKQWTYRSKINGYFECPDLFQLPVDGATNNLMWLLCDASSGYQLGQFDGVAFTPSTAKLPGNSGSAFYASQTFTAMPPGDNRVIRIGWAQISMPGMPFNQMMYFPTELTLHTTPNGVRLFSTPIAELANNAVNVYAWTNFTVSPGFNPLAGIRGTLFALQAQFAVGTAQAIVFSFQGVTVTYNVATQQISCNGVTNSLAAINGYIQLEIVVDRKSVEIFGNHGQLYMPLPADNPVSTSLLSVGCSGGNAVFSSLTVNKLKSIWTGTSKL